MEEHPDLAVAVDDLIEGTSLLDHPFYRMWVEGTLPQSSLGEYARQYNAFEHDLPRVLSIMLARCDDDDYRQVLLQNLWDEEYGPDNHVELWLRFAAGLGLFRESVREAQPNPATELLCETYRRLAEESTHAGVAALYAYERQVPALASVKLEGLPAYGVKPPSTRFFEVHSELDVDHAAGERQIIASTPLTEHWQVLGAVRSALDAWWGFLDAIDTTGGGSEPDVASMDVAAR